jgi:hypothetical protein
MSCPLQDCCNNEPGLSADAFSGKIGGCDATGKSEGRTTTGSSTTGDLFFRFRLDKEDKLEVAVFVFLAPPKDRFDGFFALAADDGVVDFVFVFGLTLLLRFTATDRFVAEDNAIIGYYCCTMIRYGAASYYLSVQCILGSIVVLSVAVVSYDAIFLVLFCNRIFVKNNRQ